MVDMENNVLFFEAIARRKCIAATYNRQSFMLAPHILYTRHDEMFIDAVTIKRDGQPPREVKIGSFKLAGLTDVSIESAEFAPVPIFNPEEAKYAGATLFAVEL